MPKDIDFIAPVVVKTEPEAGSKDIADNLSTAVGAGLCVSAGCQGPNWYSDTDYSLAEIYNNNETAQQTPETIAQWLSSPQQITVCAAATTPPSG
jgi:hypothetical protein